MSSSGLFPKSDEIFNIVLISIFKSYPYQIFAFYTRLNFAYTWNNLHA